MMRQNFNYQPQLIGETLSIRPLEANDYSALFACASDKHIWAGHPATDRYKEDVFAKMFDEGLASQACVVISENDTGKLVGWSRYYVAEDGPQDISIGFTFLSRAHWGGQSNGQVKRLMLKHAFEYFDNVWFHIAPTNIRSQKATQKLGAKLINESLLTLGGKEGLWQSYKLEKAQWS
jgi:RimJ/RimL family protein N-acetyltransferase